MGATFGGGQKNAMGTAPAFAGGVGTPQSAMNLPADAFGPSPGAGMPSAQSVFAGNQPDQEGGVAGAMTGLSQNMGPLMAAMQTRPGTPMTPFASPDSSFIAPPTERLGAQPQQRSAFYGG